MTEEEVKTAEEFEQFLDTLTKDQVTLLGILCISRCPSIDHMMIITGGGFAHLLKTKGSIVGNDDSTKLFVDSIEQFAKSREIYGTEGVKWVRRRIK